MIPPAVQKAIDRLGVLIAEADKLGTQSVPIPRVIVTSSQRNAPRQTKEVAANSDILNVRFRQAIVDIAPNTEYSKHADGCKQTIDLRNVAVALKDDLEAGHGQSLYFLAHAEVFSDVLDEAQYLLDEGYIIAAAVTAGSAGEAHLKRLAGLNGVDTVKLDGSPIKADTINAELAKKGIYDKTVAKHITAWQGIRNDAAHGDAAKVKESLVSGLIDGLRRFMKEYPA